MLLTNIPIPDEGIYHKQENTTAFIDGKDVGNGSLFITERSYFRNREVAYDITHHELSFLLETPKLFFNRILMYFEH